MIKYLVGVLLLSIIGLFTVIIVLAKFIITSGIWVKIAFLGLVAVGIIALISKMRRS